MGSLILLSLKQSKQYLESYALSPPNQLLQSMLLDWSVIMII